MPRSIISAVPPLLITLTTDFGLRDHYVGAMKGVIAGIAPAARIIDICHQIPPYDVAEAAFTIAQAYHWFPQGSIHVVVVDPGVGSARRPIAAEAGGHLFVAPDNGVLSQVFERSAPAVFAIDVERIALKPASRTFHGRDLFAPLAARLANGLPVVDTGDAITDYIRLEPTKPVEESPGRWKGRVLHVDQFGNLVTSLPVEILDKSANNFRLTVGGLEITRAAKSYAEAPPNKAFAIAGSSGYVEVSINQASAADLAGVGAGAPVRLSETALLPPRTP